MDLQVGGVLNAATALFACPLSRKATLVTEYIPSHTFPQALFAQPSHKKYGPQPRPVLHTTHVFFESWLTEVGGLSLEERGAHVTIAHWIIKKRKWLSESDCMRCLSVNKQRWSRIKKRLVEFGALVENISTGDVMIPSLKGRLHKTGYAYIKKSIPSNLRWKVFKRDEYRCLYCGSGEDLTADHIISEVNGGESVYENLQTLCRPCNSAKGGEE